MSKLAAFEYLFLCDGNTWNSLSAFEKAFGRFLESQGLVGERVNRGDNRPTMFIKRAGSTPVDNVGPGNTTTDQLKNLVSKSLNGEI